MVDEYEEKVKMRAQNKGNKGGNFRDHSVDKMNKRDSKAMEKQFETKDSLEYDNNIRNVNSEMVQRTGSDWDSVNILFITFLL